MAPNIYCAGAGTAADCDHVTGKSLLSKTLLSVESYGLISELNQFFINFAEMIKRELELHRFNSHSESRVQMAVGRLAHHVFRYGGHIGAHCIVGGVDCKGPQLIEVGADGHHKAGPFVTMGSGSLAAMAIMETDYRENMTQEEATALVTKAIEAGIYHDLGSGSNVDVVIIKRGKVEFMKAVKSDNFKVFSKPDGYSFRPDRAQVLEEYKHKIVVANGEEPMQLT